MRFLQCILRSLFGELKGCDRCLGVEGCDRCLGSSGDAIAIWELRGCDRFWGVEGVRSLFGRLRGAISLSLCPLCLCGSLKKDVWGS
ncbi:MAG: hypothetical protein ACK513_02060 [Aphanizomenon sp.]